jgi:Mlc titration factor MtfA (ptsG expression regulator)
VIQYHYWSRFRPIDIETKTTLKKYSSYYLNLNSKEKSLFERRVVLFIRSKDFIGKDDLKITPLMQVLIAATAVQITFGFKYFQLPRFIKIFIYPKEYYSPVTKKWHKGEVFPIGKSISLSWNNFLKGFSNPTDGINLGIHEMTHAMSLENKFSKNGVSGFIKPRAYKKWNVLAQEEINKIKENQPSLFRKYAATNIEEFLSVSLEVFFEQTQEFSKYNPHLYMATVRILNQNPLHFNNNPQKESGI